MRSDILEYWENRNSRYLSESYNFSQQTGRYPFSELRLQRVTELLRDMNPGRCLDAGCGKGILLRLLIEGGWDAYGCDFSRVMVEAATQHLADGQQDVARIRLTSVDDLSAYQDATFDLVTCFGVLDYLRPEPGMEERALSEFQRVLKPGGLLWVDNVNELFDLTTFNRFTVEFFQKNFLTLFFPDPHEQAEIAGALRQLVSRPDAPERQGKWSTDRDKVAQIADNPLTFGRRMRAFGFDEIDQLYIRFHAVPPLLFAERPDLELRTIEKEKDLCRDWRGLFLASLFLTVLRRRA